MIMLTKGFPIGCVGEWIDLYIPLSEVCVRASMVVEGSIDPHSSTAKRLELGHPRQSLSIAY